MLVDLPPVQTSQSNNHVMIDGISEQLVQLKNDSATFPDTGFSFGVYKESLALSMQKDYRPSGLGISLGVQHYIRSWWRGGIEFRWTDWGAKKQSNSDTENPTSLSPLSIFSKIDGVPPLQGLYGENLASWFQPYFTGGLGYTIFFKDRALLSIPSKSTFGQFSVTYGAGFRVIIPKSFQIRVSMENWRGVENSLYKAQIYKLEFVLGDVDRI